MRASEMKPVQLVGGPRDGELTTYIGPTLYEWGLKADGKPEQLEYEFHDGVYVLVEAKA